MSVDELAAAHLEHGERVADLAALKPAERTALYLQALGYRYREIGAATAASYTAVNRRGSPRAELACVGSPAIALTKHRPDRDMEAPQAPRRHRAQTAAPDRGVSKPSAGRLAGER